MKECPLCQGPMERSKREYILRGLNLGAFECDVCHDCGEEVFTKAASEEIDKLAYEMSIWGLESRSLEP